jgi:hypothetical protein
MHNKLRQIFFIMCCITLANNLQAQVNSPYSRIGLGNIFPTTFTASNGMGGLSIAQFSEGLSANNIQFMNPATYSYLSKTIFDIGVYANFLSLQTNTEDFTSGNANLSYFAFGFSPNNKKTRHDFGFSTGLIPFSGFQYNIEKDSINTTDTLIGLQTTNYRGEGTLYQYYLGAGYNYKFGKDTLRRGNYKSSIGVGINTGYLFGNLQNITVAYFPENTNSLATKYVRSTEVNGGLFSAGITYQTTFGRYDMNRDGDNKNSDTLYTFNFGAGFSPQLLVDGTQSVSWYTIAKAGDIEQITDTLLVENDTSASILIPAQFHAGISINNYKALGERTRFSVGSEFSTMLWGNFQGFQYSDSLANSFRLKIGTEVIPIRPEKTGKIRRPIIYRFGGYGGKSNLVINGVQLSDFGITAGMGIPVGVSRLNISANLGFRGNNSDLQETYINFGAGFNLYDLQWFQKRQQN